MARKTVTAATVLIARKSHEVIYGKNSSNFYFVKCLWFNGEITQVPYVDLVPERPFHP